MYRLNTLHNHRSPLNRIDDADPMEVNTRLGASGLNVVGRKQQHRVRFEVLSVFVAALPFDAGKTGAFESANVIIQAPLIPGCGSDPGIVVDLFLHAAAESPFIQILQAAEILECRLERHRDEGGGSEGISFHKKSS